MFDVRGHGQARQADWLEPGQHHLLRRFTWYPYRAMRTVLRISYANALLIFAPVGLVAGALGWAYEAVFFLNLLGIIPLAYWIALLLGDVATYTGQVPAGLLKATLGNTVELAVRHLLLIEVSALSFFFFFSRCLS